MACSPALLGGSRRRRPNALSRQGWRWLDADGAALLKLHGRRVCEAEPKALLCREPLHLAPSLICQFVGPPGGGRLCLRSTLAVHSVTTSLAPSVTLARQHPEPQTPAPRRHRSLSPLCS